LSSTHRTGARRAEPRVQRRSIQDLSAHKV